MAQTIELPDPTQVDEMAWLLVRQGRGQDLIEVRVPSRTKIGNVARVLQVRACFRVVASRLQPGVDVIEVSAVGWLALRGLVNGSL
mgnify:CR=1 FL=1